MGDAMGMHCSTPHCRFRANHAEPREKGVGFGIYGLENPHLPIFIIFGGQGKPGEGGGTWDTAQGPGGIAGRVPARASIYF